MMKEKLYTIEMTDALHADDECCFCWLERKLERETLEFVLGSSYMESDIREETSRQGFCRRHAKMMYDYGNTLGNAWILKSRLETVREMFARQMAQNGFAGETVPGNGTSAHSGGAKAGGRESGDGDSSRKGTTKGGARLLGMLRRQSAKNTVGASLADWLRKEECSCYICGRMETVYARMQNTFIYMLRNDSEFTKKFLAGKGLCLPHFADVLETCGKQLSETEMGQWEPLLYQMMARNLDRVQEDVDWLIEKYDYRNRDADWRQSRDALPRGMQKLTGGYPADEVFRNRK